MDKIRYQKKIAELRKQYEGKPCETCGKQHDHTYGTGRFCSQHCRCAYGKTNGASPKLKAHLAKLRAKGKIGKKAPYGTWKCTHCQEVFETRSQLKQHLVDKHNYKTVKSCEQFQCQYCKIVFRKHVSLMAHLRSCVMHPNKQMHDNAYKEQGKKMHQFYSKYPEKFVWFGKHHSDITKQLMRIRACKYLQSIRATPCRYNKKSISVLESIAKEHSWNIQHAENGGEFYTGIGYFVDAYDKDKNVVLEYDEPVHYIDAENNVLREKDVKRQQRIIDYLHCEYWRYNEKTRKLWKVN